MKYNVLALVWEKKKHQQHINYKVIVNATQPETVKGDVQRCVSKNYLFLWRELRETADKTINLLLKNNKNRETFSCPHVSRNVLQNIYGYITGIN